MAAVNAKSGTTSKANDSNNKASKDSWLKILGKGITKSGLDAVSCGLACAAFVPIQRTVMGQSIIWGDVTKIALTCAFRAGILSPFKDIVKLGIHGDPKKENNTQNNPKVAIEYQKGKTNPTLQFLKDSLETLIITAIEAVPGTYQESITAKSVDLPMIAGLTVAKSLPGNSMSTKTYKDGSKDEGHQDVITRVSQQRHINGVIENHRRFFQFAKNTADCFSLATWVNKGIDVALPAKNKKQEFDKAIFKNDIHNSISFSDKTLAQDVFVDGVTLKDLIDRKILKEDITIEKNIDTNTLVKDIFNNNTLAKDIFDTKTLAKDIFSDNAIKQDIAAKEKLSKDITEYLMTGVAALVSTVPATMLSNTPLTPANFAKTFALRFVSIGLWSGALNIAGKIHSRMWDNNNPPPAKKKPSEIKTSITEQTYSEYLKDVLSDASQILQGNLPPKRNPVKLKPLFSSNNDTQQQQA